MWYPDFYADSKSHCNHDRRTDAYFTSPCALWVNRYIINFSKVANNLNPLLYRWKLVGKDSEIDDLPNAFPWPGELVTNLGVYRHWLVSLSSNLSVSWFIKDGFHRGWSLLIQFGSSPDTSGFLLVGDFACQNKKWVKKYNSRNRTF
jgi:hypothetical protein